MQALSRHVIFETLPSLMITLSPNTGQNGVTTESSGRRLLARRTDMPPSLQRSRLKMVAEATSVRVKTWKEGVALERDSRKPIANLLCRVAADRWALAYRLRAQANQLFGAHHYRSAISRYYYSMYHSMRASVFIHHEGDDHEKHSDLPLHIPPGFDPTATDWQTKLKDARLLRNRVDYESYPKSENAWKKDAHTIRQDANLLLTVSRQYLMSKGCSI